MLIIEFVNDKTGDADVAHYQYRVRLDQQLLVERARFATITATSVGSNW